MTNTFIGLQYPLVKTSRGVMAQKKDVDQIKADILQLLLTNPGERVMMPQFGTPLRTLVFEQNDAALELTATNMIATAIKNWEPRVVITNIAVTSQVSKTDLNPQDSLDEVDHILGIKIQFVNPTNLSQTEELVMQLPIGD